MTPNKEIISTGGNPVTFAIMPYQASGSQERPNRKIRFDDEEARMSPDEYQRAFDRLHKQLGMEGNQYIKS